MSIVSRISCQRGDCRARLGFDTSRRQFKHRLEIGESRLFALRGFAVIVPVSDALAYIGVLGQLLDRREAKNLPPPVDSCEHVIAVQRRQVEVPLETVLRGVDQRFRGGLFRVSLFSVVLSVARV